MADVMFAIKVMMDFHRPKCQLRLMSGHGRLATVETNKFPSRGKLECTGYVIRADKATVYWFDVKSFGFFIKMLSNVQSTLSKAFKGYESCSSKTVWTTPNEAKAVCALSTRPPSHLPRQTFLLLLSWIYADWCTGNKIFPSTGENVWKSIFGW